MDELLVRRRTALGVGAAALAVSSAACRPDSSASPWRFFTAPEAAAVDAICEQIIPKDQDPGAHDAGVVNYIDIQLATRLRRFRQIYRNGIASVAQVSQSTFGKQFPELSFEQQTGILRGIEESNKTFFNLIFQHTQQGFYGDPRHGGNRDRVSWRMVGLTYPPVRGRQHYDEPGVG